MLKSNIDILFVTSFLCSLQFLLFHRIEYPKRCLWKKIEIFLWLSFCDTTTFKKQCTVPVTLTYVGKFLLLNWVQPYISILYQWRIQDYELGGAGLIYTGRRPVWRSRRLRGGRYGGGCPPSTVSKKMKNEAHIGGILGGMYVNIYG